MMDTSGKCYCDDVVMREATGDNREDKGKNHEFIYNKMRYFIGTFLASILILLLSCNDQKFSVNPDDRISSEKLIEDLEDFREKMIKEHPGLHNPHNKIEFLQNCDSIADRIQSALTTKEFYSKMAWLSSSLRCGHTRLSYPEGYWDKVDDGYKHLPLQLYLTGSEIYVREIFCSKEIKLRNCLVSINPIISS